METTPWAPGATQKTCTGSSLQPETLLTPLGPGEVPSEPDSDDTATGPLTRLGRLVAPGPRGAAAPRPRRHSCFPPSAPPSTPARPPYTTKAATGGDTPG
ncbi:unnamed protein product [Prorocentrum cordatum]|uniref:Uncharacterized protein n=1 Tax=Prorocentrum cordatum TaxID=2364126 RepID=A0ABN9QYU5_9DINO|nr:unnamed protein product [Polarella glacialis]